MLVDIQSAEEEEAKASSELAAAIAALPNASTGTADAGDAPASSAAPAVPPTPPAESPEQQAVAVATKVNHPVTMILGASCYD